MFISNSVARNLGRCSTTVALTLLVLSCGGGGAVLEPDQTATPGNPASPPAAPPAAGTPAPPAAPAPGAVVTTPGDVFSPEEIHDGMKGRIRVR